MRRNIIREFDKLAEDLSNFTAMFNYRLKDLCVKAEEVALLPVKVLIEGELQSLEKCTTIAKQDDYNFMIFPHYDEDMQALQQGIMAVHPEFKQKIESMKIDVTTKGGESQEQDARYVLVTMPEVDDDRYDLLTDAVKAMYEQCKGQMEAANTKADVKLAELTAGEDKETVDLIKAKRDELNEEWNAKRDDIYNAKLQEIEDAYNKWLSQVGQQELARMEEEDARGNDVARSMRMGQQSDEDAN